MLDIGARDAAIDLARLLARDEAFKTALADLIAFPTDASVPDAPLREFLLHVSLGFQAMGFQTQGLTAQGHPFLLASRIEDPTRPTILGYAHGDTVPGMDGQWDAGRDPWSLTEDPTHGRWYGRGIADNKGQMLVNMTALQAVIAARGKLGFNMHFVVEMGEEIGSPGLKRLLNRLKPSLSADVLVASDGPRLSAGQPTVFLGARGAVTCKLHLKRRDGGRHSGNFGGALRNPALELAHALSTLSSASGALQVRDLTPSEIPEVTREALAGLTPAGGEVDADWGTEGLTPAERIHAWNSIEILSLKAGATGDPVNAIPGEATAYVQLRFVPGITPEDVPRILARHLSERGFPDIEVTPHGAAFKAAATPADAPAAQFAINAIKRTLGHDPVVLPSLGGSLPNDIFVEDLGIPAIWVPHSYPGCSQHAPNEHLPAEIFPDATGLMAGLFWDLGEAQPSELGIRN